MLRMEKLKKSQLPSWQVTLDPLVLLFPPIFELGSWGKFMKIRWIHSVGLGEGKYRTGGWSSPLADVETLGTFKKWLKSCLDMVVCGSLLEFFSGDLM